MFQRQTSFTIPSLKNKVEENIKRKAWERQEDAKRQRTEYRDKKTNAKDHNVNVGDTVILKQQKHKKLSTNFEPRQYKVTATNQNMITATDSSGQFARSRKVSHATVELQTRRTRRGSCRRTRSTSRRRTRRSCTAISASRQKTGRSIWSVIHMNIYTIADT